MTDPVAGGVTTQDFAGVPWPTDAQNRVVNMLISGAPFARSLTRQPTDRRTVAWPTARPSGGAWVDELDRLPTMYLGDDSYTVAVVKIGGIIPLSNESIDDTTMNMSDTVATLFRDSLSRDLDLGLLSGAGGLEPVGIIGTAPEITGDSLAETVATAKGQIGDAGGNPTTIAISATQLAAADIERGTNGQLVYANGFAASAGLTPVIVPGLIKPMVYDPTRVILVVRRDFRVDFSRDYLFSNDAAALRIVGRFAAAIPNVDQAIRKLTIAE